MHILSLVPKCDNHSKYVIGFTLLNGDLIETFKILKGLEGIPLNSFFELNTSVTRGNSLKLNKLRSRLNIRYNNFSQCVINAWNGLPERVISWIQKQPR